MVHAGHHRLDTSIRGDVVGQFVRSDSPRLRNRLVRIADRDLLRRDANSGSQASVPQ